VEPGLFQQIGGPRTLVYRTDAQGAVTQLFFGQFAYFKIPTYQTVLFQLGLVAGALLIMFTGVIAWPIAWLVRRRRGPRAAPWTTSWTGAARWTASLLALFNTALLAWLVVALLAYADTLVYPATLLVRLTQLWWINVPAVLALLLLSSVAWRQHSWSVAWRVHYTLVTVASVVFLAFLLNWHLLAGL
jgi:hypothetical protein